MKLSTLPAAKSLKGVRVLLRVDWNVPLEGGGGAEDSLKLTRSVETVKMLKSRGAIVLIATHIGRPKKMEAALSTKRLVSTLAMSHALHLAQLPERLDKAADLDKIKQIVGAAKPGTVFLLENLRFFAGEEKNDKAFAKGLASLADIYMDDAFAATHRAHASIVGVPKLLPAYAGPALLAEVAALEKLITKPKKPFVAIVGGMKITTKIGVINVLLKTADAVCVGGAMANALFAAKGYSIGSSYIEKEGIPLAKKLLKNKKLHIPVDVVVDVKDKNVHVTTPDAVKKNERIGDIGPGTMRAWAGLIKSAKTIAWNGPVGISRLPSFSHGSLLLAHAIGMQSRGKTFGVAGGGDTLPVIAQSHMGEYFDFVSTGGGAMLEFIAKKGKLPGLLALMKK